MFISSEAFGFYLKKFHEKERVILYGKTELISNLKKYTEILGFKVAECYFCDQREDNSYINIMYEEPGKYYVWIVSEEYIDLSDRLDEIGLIQHQDYATIFRPPYMNLRERFPLDTHLGYTSLSDGKYPGVTIFGNEDSNKELIKIVTLGGSTSDAQAYPWKSWSEILYETFINMGVNNVVIYSAGVCGYTSAQELIKLQRDMVSINPQVVISLSGVNDCYVRKNAWFTDYQEAMFSQLALRGFKDLTYGINIGYSNGFEEEKSPSEMWLKNIKMMYAICKEYGIAFFSFLQPMAGAQGMNMKGAAKEYIGSSLANRMFFFREFLLETQKQLADYNYIYDISDALVEHEEVFIDSVHVTEEGNTIIANKILRVLRENKQIKRNC